VTLSPPSYLLFLDESGDPTLNYAGRTAAQSPEIFLLCGCLFTAEEHAQLRPALDDLKQRHLGRTDVSLVSRQIRKQKAPFTFLVDPLKRMAFYADTGAVIQQAHFTVFAAGIDKFRHWERYGASAWSPYNLSLAFILERVTRVVEDAGGRVHVIAEGRGRLEDDALRLEFARLRTQGTRYVAAKRIRTCFTRRIEFRRKRDNIAGLQMTDLVAYPIANRLCYPASRRIDFAIVQAKLYRSSRGVWGAGLKVFPAARAADFGL
jgi:hypothetical protein